MLAVFTVAAMASLAEGARPAVLLIRPGPPPGFGCDAMPGLDCREVVCPFDELTRARGTAEAVRESARAVEEAIAAADGCRAVISVSRGATVLADLVARGRWRGAALFLSPVPHGGPEDPDELYAALVEDTRGANVAFATGTSVDETVLIAEPIVAAGGSVARFPGGHEWCAGRGDLVEGLVVAMLGGGDGEAGGPARDL